jgi:hypothetical protein
VAAPGSSKGSSPGKEADSIKADRARLRATLVWLRPAMPMPSRR